MSNSGQSPRSGGGDIDETVLALVSQMEQGFLGKVRASQPGVGLLSQGQGFLVRGGASQPGVGLPSQRQEISIGWVRNSLLKALSCICIIERVIGMRTLGT